MDNGNCSEKRVLGSFLLGGLIGAGAALLFAPQSGKKTRRNISRFTKNVAGDAKNMIEDATDSMHELVGSISDRLSELASSGKEIAEDSRKKIVRSLDTLQKTIEKQKEKLI